MYMSNVYMLSHIITYYTNLYLLVSIMDKYISLSEVFSVDLKLKN